MTGDHQGRTSEKATLQVRAADEILGTHSLNARAATVGSALNCSYYQPTRMDLSMERSKINRAAGGNFLTDKPNLRSGNGDRGEFDLQYIASGSGSGWGSNLNHLYYWTNKYRPGPTIIAGILNNDNFSGENPAGMLAHVGDRLYAAMDTEAEGFNIVFYMQVIEVREEGVLVKMWLWNSA
jgi:hypothetical protein